MIWLSLFLLQRIIGTWPSNWAPIPWTTSFLVMPKSIIIIIFFVFHNTTLSLISPWLSVSTRSIIAGQSQMCLNFSSFVLQSIASHVLPFFFVNFKRSKCIAHWTDKAALQGTVHQRPPAYSQYAPSFNKRSREVQVQYCAIKDTRWDLSI